MKVFIKQFTKNAMQSGNNKNYWRIEPVIDRSKYLSKPMSWTGSSDMNQELELTFVTKEQAVYFADNNNWSYQIIYPKYKKLIAKSYDDNFPIS